jgi:hypothetical protein
LTIPSPIKAGIFNHRKSFPAKCDRIKKYPSTEHKTQERLLSLQLTC